MSNLESLVINSSGFIFDKTSGESYTTNDSAKRILELLISGSDVTVVSKQITEEFDVSFEEVYVDVLDIIGKLKQFGLYRQSA